MEQLYVLQLVGGKYYVGKTKNVADRYKQHISGDGAAWTRKHAPTKLIETRGLKDEHDETNVTKDFMKKYGVDNVRGGAYVSIEIDEATKSVLEREFRGDNDKCFKCGLGGHFANRCPITIREETEPEEVWGCEYCDKEFTSMTRAISHERRCTSKPQPRPAKKTGACYRCGRNSHHASTCYAKTHIDGNDLEEESEQDYGDCSRCGREGHGSSECYAKRHVDGSKL
jgi:cellular nucleic acid-binding protein